MQLSTGTKFGPYEILAPLGAGGMGEVYKAYDERLRREVALKTLPLSLANDPARRARFETEARSASALNHPGIVTVHDIGYENGISYIVTEFVDGQTLRQSRPESLRQQLDVAAQVADALAAAHAKGITHRDLKPENIMVTRDGRAKILDFGLAKTSGPAGEQEATQTLPGAVMGTVGYMSPEQVRGQPADTRSDIFSLGVVLYELLSGRPAFPGASAVEILNGALKSDPADLPPGLPPGLPQVVRRCLEKEPERRFQSAADLAFALRSLSGISTDVFAGSATPAPIVSRRDWGKRAAFAAAGLAAGGGGAWFAGLSRTPLLTFRTLPVRDIDLPSAPITPDGHTWVYAQLPKVRGLPRLFTYTLQSGLARELPILPGYIPLAASVKGEILITRQTSTLARLTSGALLERVALSGGSPKEVLDQVAAADWSPDGEQIAVVRFAGAKRRVEYPIGAVLAESLELAWWNIAVSPDGQSVAVVERDANDSRIVLFDLRGQRRVLATSVRTLRICWRRDRPEIWWSSDGPQSRIEAVNPSGHRRVVIQSLAGASLVALAPGGMAILARGTGRSGIAWHIPGASADQQTDRGQPAHLSDDGKRLYFTDAGETFLQRTDGSASVRLGEGRPTGRCAESPDGNWLAMVRPTRDPDNSVLLPTGAGQERPLRGRLVAWFPDGQRYLLSDKGNRISIERFEGGTTSPAFPEGKNPPPLRDMSLSPEGQRLSGLTPDGKWTIYTLGGSAGHIVPGLDATDVQLAWMPDGRWWLVTKNAGPWGVYQVDRVEVSTGRRDPFQTINSPYTKENTMLLLMTPDGRGHAYYFHNTLSDIYLVEGLE